MQSKKEKSELDGGGQVLALHGEKDRPGVVINFSRPVNRQNGGAGQLERAARRAVKPLSWEHVLTPQVWLMGGPRCAGAANLALQSMLCFSWVAFLADVDITVGTVEGRILHVYYRVE